MIFLWRGRGWLVPLLFIFGLFAGGAVAMAVKGTGSGLLVLASGFWGATVLLLLFALWWGKSSEYVLMDPATHQSVRVRRTHSFWFLGGKVWAAVVGGLACLVTVVALMETRDQEQAEGLEDLSSPGAAAFVEADRAIRNLGASGAAHGNLAVAERLAGQFADAVQRMREETISQGRRPSFSLTGGEFLTYCHLDSEIGVFLVQVPELRKFDDEAKEWMGIVCWMAARSVLEQHAAKDAGAIYEPERLVVALRGVVRYDRVLEGTLEPIEAGADAGLESTTVGPESRDAIVAHFDQIIDRQQAAIAAAREAAAGAVAEVVAVADEAAVDAPAVEEPEVAEAAGDAEPAAPAGQEVAAMDEDAADEPAPDQPADGAQPTRPQPGDPGTATLAIEVDADSGTVTVRAPDDAGSPPDAAEPEADAADQAEAMEAEPVLPTEVRDWRDQEGRVMRASVLAFGPEAADEAEFEREDGVRFTVPIERFAPADQQELRALRDSAAP